MSVAEDPGGCEHVGDKYVTYNKCKEGRPRYYFPPFPPISEEEEEAQREAERSAERDVEHKVKRMLGDIYERLEGSGKGPMEPGSNLHVGSRQYGSQSAGHDSVLGTDGR
jgi:hypothetical protein